MFLQAPSTGMRWHGREVCILALLTRCSAAALPAWRSSEALRGELKQEGLKKMIPKQASSQKRLQKSSEEGAHPASSLLPRPFATAPSPPRCWSPCQTQEKLKLINLN